MKGLLFSEIGEITADGKFSATGLDGRQIINESVDVLKEAWQKRWIFEAGSFLCPEKSEQ